MSEATQRWQDDVCSGSAHLKRLFESKFSIAPHFLLVLDPEVEQTQFQTAFVQQWICQSNRFYQKDKNKAVAPMAKRYLEPNSRLIWL